MVVRLIAWWESVKVEWAREILADELARMENHMNWWEHELDVCEAQLDGAHGALKQYMMANAKLVRKLDKCRRKLKGKKS